MDRIKRLFGKLFLGGSWKTAYRLQDGKDQEYTVVPAPQGTWIADPMLFEKDGQHYLFVELFDEKKDKAGIGYYQFVNGKPQFRKQIIEEPYHLSYPCVFTWEGTCYMIPESAAGNTLDLYRAVHFPDEWVLDSNLIRGEKYVDTTVTEQEGEIYALGYHKTGNKWGLTVFRLDMRQKALIRCTEEIFTENVGRPAGYILQKEMLRPAQDCSRLYGESVIWYKIDRMSEDGYEEHPVSKMRVEDLPVPGKADRVHTYSRDSKYEAVDLRYGRFDLFHGLKTLRRAYNGAKLNRNPAG